MSIYQNEDANTNANGDGKSFLLQNLKDKENKAGQENNVGAEMKETPDTGATILKVKLKGINFIGKEIKQFRQKSAKLINSFHHPPSLIYFMYRP